NQVGGLCHFLIEVGVNFFHRLVAIEKSVAMDLKVADVATTVFVYLHPEAARDQLIVKVAIADDGEVASCWYRFFGAEFLGQPMPVEAVAEVAAHNERIVLLR